MEMVTGTHAVSYSSQQHAGPTPATDACGHLGYFSTVVSGTHQGACHDTFSTLLPARVAGRARWLHRGCGTATMHPERPLTTSRAGAG
jgi:hypothetical protein